MPTYDDEQKKRFFNITKTEDEYGKMVGRMYTRTSENDPHGVKRVYKKDDGSETTTYRRYYPSIGGIITKITIEKKEGKKGNYFVWAIEMDGGYGEIYLLNVNLKSSSSNSIMHRLPSCDLTKEIKFKPFYFADKERIVTVLYQREEDDKWEKVDKYWSYDDVKKTMTNGMPDMVVTEDKVTGEKDYNDKAQNEFMWTYFNNKLFPIFEKNAETVSKPAPSQADTEAPPEVEKEVGDHNEEDITKEDLPF